MDEYNYEDLYELTDYLLDRFKNFSNFNMYSSLLYEYCTDKVNNRKTDNRHKMIERQIKLLTYIKEHDKMTSGELAKSHRIVHCMGDNDSAVLVLPDGNLGKCEHYIDDHYIGNIYDENINIDMLSQFRELEYRDKNNCPDCKFEPFCNVLKLCLTVPRRCDEIDKVFTTKTLELKMLNTYEEYLKRN